MIDFRETQLEVVHTSHVLKTSSNLERLDSASPVSVDEREKGEMEEQGHG